LLYDFKRQFLKIGNKHLKNCLTFTVEERWPLTSASGKVWLHKNYGIVKWIRVTGRIEEMKFE